MTDYRRKHLTILKNLYSNDSVLVGMAARAQKTFEPGEAEAFNAFQIDVGNLFIELKEELDQCLEDMADHCPEEPDPRKWGPADWAVFELAVSGHKHEDILRTFAAGIPNINLIWGELDNRIDLP